MLSETSTARRLRALRANNPGYSTQKNAAWKAGNREKYLAHKKVEYAVKVGKMVKLPCERCGALRAHAHHDDYSKPYDVMWLCATHHKQRHVELGAQF